MAENRKENTPHVEISSSQSAVRVPRKKLFELVAFVSAAEGVRLSDIDIAVVNSAEIARLNRQWLRHSGPTDVISFDMSSPADTAISAQIIVCGDVAAAEARSRGLGVQRELMLYVVHGLLHLMGYDDTDPESSQVMHARQQQLLDEFRRM